LVKVSSLSGTAAVGRTICRISPCHQRGSSAHLRAVAVDAAGAAATAGAAVATIGAAVAIVAAPAAGVPTSSRITTALLSTQTAAIATPAMVNERARDKRPGVSVKAYS
jgi:hypothetical protein